MIPLYGFMEGDTLGLLVFAYPQDTMSVLAQKLQNSASIRVAKVAKVELIYKGKVLDGDLTVASAQMEALDRIDVRRTKQS